MDDEGVVYKLSRDASDSEDRPVYVLESGGSRAVATGLVFVRFKPGVKAADRVRDIENAGYEIDQTLDYAPEAAWVRAKSGDIADALRQISHLEGTSDVENVEPQMLMRRSSK